MATEFTPQQVASLITVADRTLRHWSSRFSNYLSPMARSEATGRGNSHRKYTAQDVEMLRRIKLLSEQKVRLTEIEDVLSGRKDLPAVAPPIPIRRGADSGGAQIEHIGPQADAIRSMTAMMEENRRLLAAMQDHLTRATRSLTDRLDTLQARMELLERRSEERLESIDRRLIERIQSMERESLERGEPVDGMLDAVDSPGPTNGGGLFAFLKRGQRTKNRVGPLSRNLIRLMAGRRWGRNDLALYSHVRVETITRILSGELTDPKPQVLEALAQALGTSPEVLTAGRAEESSPFFSR